MLTKLPPYDEKELLLHIADGDERAFRIFFDLYRNRFYAVVLKMTKSDLVAEEIVQEVFMHIWEKRELLRNVQAPSAYFFTAVYRRIYNHYKRLALERRMLGHEAQSIGITDATNETVLANESKRLISKAIASLPPQQQLVFKLSKEAGLTREQVAKELNISPNTVKNHLGEAIKTIRVYLDKAGLAGFYLFWIFKDKL